MNTPEATDLKIYEINNRETGEKSYQPATTAEDACKQAGWLIGNCFVIEVKPQRKPTGDGHSALMVKIPCHTCPYRYAICLKPDAEECPVQSTATELQEWLKQIAQARLCEFVGEELTRADYYKQQKWLKFHYAIKELTPQSFSPTENP